MRKYFLILLLLISGSGFSQAPNIIYGKDVIIQTRDTSSAELTIKNSTRNVLGYFKNIGGGKGQYVIIPQTDITGLPDSLLARYTKAQADSRFKTINYVPAWIEITDKPANFSTTYALSNDVKDSIQKRLAVTLTSPATGNLIRFNGSEWVNWIPNYLSFTDSSTILGGRWLPNRSADSIAVIRALANSKGIGTVTSISAGTGMNFTTITGTGTVNADTSVLSTKANVTGLLTGYATTGTLSGKLNVADTSGMLGGYKTYYPRTAISLTTTGTSGAATYNSSTGVLNIPNYTPDLSAYLLKSDSSIYFSNVVRTFGDQTILGAKTFSSSVTSTGAFVSTRSNATVNYFAQMNISTAGDSTDVILGRSASGTYNLFALTQRQEVTNQSTGMVAINVYDNGGKIMVQEWTRNFVTFNRPVIFNGTVTFGAGQPTSISGSDGRIITDKFRIYNSVPATNYHDFTSSATTNRTITIPNVSGTMVIGSGTSSQFIMADGSFATRNTLTFGRGLNGGTYNTVSNVTATLDTTGSYTWTGANNRFQGNLSAGDYDGGYNFYAAGGTSGTGYLGAGAITWNQGDMVMGNITSFTRSNHNSAGLYLGLTSSTAGSSLFIKTSGLTVSSTDYSHGLAINGSYSGGLATTNIRAIGTNTTGGYGSAIDFYTEANAVQTRVFRLSNDLSATFYGSLFANGNGVSLNVSSANSNNFKMSLQDNGTPRTYFGANSTNVLEIANGSVTTVATINATTGAYTATSDSSAKINITDALEALPLLDSIKIRQYDWKESNVHEPFGIIAQELFKVTPTYVSVPSDSTGRWGIQKAELVPMIIKGIQEQNKKINDVKARLKKLEAILNKQ